jgi:hypothetical protein
VRDLSPEPPRETSPAGGPRRAKRSLSRDAPFMASQIGDPMTLPDEMTRALTELRQRALRLRRAAIKSRAWLKPQSRRA